MFFIHYLKLSKSKTQVYFRRLPPPSGSISECFTTAAQPFPFPAPLIKGLYISGIGSLDCHVHAESHEDGIGGHAEGAAKHDYQDPEPSAWMI